MTRNSLILLFAVLLMSSCQKEENVILDSSENSTIDVKSSLSGESGIIGAVMPPPQSVPSGN